MPSGKSAKRTAPWELYQTLYCRDTRRHLDTHPLIFDIIVVQFTIFPTVWEL